MLTCSSCFVIGLKNTRGENKGIRNTRLKVELAALKVRQNITRIFFDYAELMREFDF
jgi:hypothetical protein